MTEGHPVSWLPWSSSQEALRQGCGSGEWGRGGWGACGGGGEGVGSPQVLAPGPPAVSFVYC